MDVKCNNLSFGEYLNNYEMIDKKVHIDTNVYIYYWKLY